MKFLIISEITKKYFFVRLFIKESLQISCIRIISCGVYGANQFNYFPTSNIHKYLQVLCGKRYKMT